MFFLLGWGGGGYRKFSDYSRVITDTHDLFIETTDVGE